MDLKKRVDIKKYKIVLPSMITSASILCGLFAIFLSINNLEDNGWYTVSCWLIILASIIDGLDGKVARLTKTSSEFGIQYDSIADVITFGVATSVVLFKQIYLAQVDANPVFYIFPMLYLLCGAIRLARFNTTATTGAKNCFYGLPIPTAAGAIVSLMLFFHWVEQNPHPIPGLSLSILPFSDGTVLRITSLYTVLVSFLMVSLIKYDVSGYFFFGEIKKHWFRSIMNVLIVLMVFFYPSLAFFLMAVFYIFYGLGRLVTGLWNKKEDDEQVETEIQTQ
jgi:CDP-diacylglycerol---serine O-phosphatidyltransferase